MKKFLGVLLLFVLFASIRCTSPVTNPGAAEKFSFAYLTDTHLNYRENGCWEGMKMAIKNAKSNNIDFIITGGDNVDIDVLKGDSLTADSLFRDYTALLEGSGISFYPTMGNHDRFLGVPETDSLYDEGLFEKYVNKSYYSFDHQGWHFVILNTTQKCEGHYCVKEEQKEWLSEDLEKLDSVTPIIVSVHVPFLSVSYPVIEGTYTDRDTFSNFKEIWDMFEGKNLKLVLQGHMHLYEEIKVKDVQFITAGAVSAKWWGGAYHGTEEGYLLVNIYDDDSFSWDYVDYGWNAKLN